MSKPMTIYLPSGTTLNVAYDAELMAFEDDGAEIRHPFISDCGRFPMDPAYYRFIPWNSGGNTMVLRKDLPSGQYMLLTAEDGGIPDHTDLKEVEKSLLGLYTKGGDCIAYITVEDIPFSCDEDDEAQSKVMTMTVIIDGKEVQRAIDHIEVTTVQVQLRQGRALSSPSRPVPVLHDGEVMQETVDGKIHILRR